jgi:hypothetical protein
MIFLVSAALLDSEAARTTDILSLFRGAVFRRHTLLVVDDPLGNSFNQSAALDIWIAKMTAPLQREVKWLTECLKRIPPTAVTRLVL